MDRKELLLMVCRHADGSVDRERYGHLCNRWSPQAQAASLAARYAKYGSGFSPAARAAAAAAARARGGGAAAEPGPVAASDMEGRTVDTGGVPYTVREGRMVPAAVDLAAETGTKQSLGPVKPGTARDPETVGRFGDAGLRDAGGRVVPGSGGRSGDGPQYQHDPNGGRTPFNPLSTLRQSGGPVTTWQPAGYGTMGRVPISRPSNETPGVQVGETFRNTDGLGEMLKRKPRFL